MLKVAAIRPSSAGENRPEFAVENVFNLSFPTGSFDGVVCIRLFNLLNRTERVAALRELGRVAATVIVSYSHGYTLKQVSRQIRWRLGMRKQLNSRLSHQQISAELSEAGLRLRELIVVAPLLSEVCLVVLTPCSR
jgi:hypothetical protein